MKSIKKLAAALGAVLACTAAAQAQQIYSFETNLDGFGPNGGGVTITPTTTSGVTNGTTALNYSVVAGATFVGALTGNVPAALNPPLAVQSILVDVTLPTAFTGGFANLGVTIFGASNNPATTPGAPTPQQFGLQAQFDDFERLGLLPVGTPTTIQLDLTSSVNPLTFESGSYNDIFGPGANQLVPTGFQFFLSKGASTSATGVTTPNAAITFQLDNVRLVGTVVPEPTTLAALGAVGGSLLVRRRRAN